MARQGSAPIEGLFGSEVRAATLGFLAQSSQPQTGYAIAKALQFGVSNVYPELKKLEAWSLVSSRPDPKGSKGYLLADEDLRRFLLRRIRILPSEEWFSSRRLAERRSTYEEAKRRSQQRPPVTASARKRPFASEFRRPAAKDRALKRAKATTSNAP